MRTIRRGFSTDYNQPVVPESKGGLENSNGTACDIIHEGAFCKFGEPSGVSPRVLLRRSGNPRRKTLGLTPRGSPDPAANLSIHTYLSLTGRGHRRIITLRKSHVALSRFP